MIDETQKAELDAHYKACEEAAFQASVEYQATQPLRDEIAALKAKINAATKHLYTAMAHSNPSKASEAFDAALKELTQ